MLAVFSVKDNKADIALAACNVAKKILEQDLENENKEHIQKLKEFIKKIEKEGEQTAGQDIKRAIEHLLSLIDLTE